MTPFAAPGNQTTSPKVVLPFYLYAAVAFLAACILLCFSPGAFSGHFFHPRLLAITHLVALGWGTMMILGASHQLVPVLTENKLYSNRLAMTSFVMAALGIPVLVYAFYSFDMGNLAKWGGRLVLLSLLSYLINLSKTMAGSKGSNVHATFVLTAVIWLFLTAFYGLTLVYDFTTGILPESTVHYLPLHAHTGIVGWFLLLIIGVGSRLFPMFLISKYENVRVLWWIYYLVNSALIIYIFLFHVIHHNQAWLFPLLLLGVATGMFIWFCIKVFRHRIRKQVDVQMKLSLASVAMIAVLVSLLLIIILVSVVSQKPSYRMVTAYGFVIFFGWITAIILGMTFKTLPFIVWNKLFHRYGANGLPGPKEIYNERAFKFMSLLYLSGFIFFLTGIFLQEMVLMKVGAMILMLAAGLYCFNVAGMLTYRIKAK